MVQQTCVTNRRQVLKLGGGAALALCAGGAIVREVFADGGTFAIGDTVQVTTPLNMRESAGLDADVLLVLPTAVIGTVESRAVAADGYHWYQITVDMVGTGWVAGEYLAPYSDDQPQGLRIQVVNGPLNLRDAPSLSGDILTTLPTGTTMRVAQADGGTWADGYHWIYVQIEAQNALLGFIADAFTAPIS